LQTTNLSNHSHVTGTTFNWAAAGSSAQATGFSTGSGNTIQQTLDNTGYAIEWVTYTVTPFANGCQGTSSDATVTMYPAPPVSFTACFDPIVTTNSKPFLLRGGIPLGGTYSGPGISNAIFNPATYGPGTFTLTYGKTNSYGCSKSTTQSITVVAPTPFTCGSNFTDVRDNQSYPTVQIGPQCWMASNLNYGSSITGDLTQRDNCIPEKFCFGDGPSTCATLGGLYQWDELMRYEDTPGSQGICPPAWHLPTEAEWTLLFNQYLGNGFAGSPLKYSGYSGFNALLDGARFKNINWNFLDFATLLWSSTPHGSEKAWAHGMNSYNPSTSLYSAGRSNAFSVRCIKD
jgi:uncharacterized protein (TIGR02145 family)